MSLKWLLSTLLLRFWKIRVVQDGYQIQIEAVSTFLMIFGVHMSIVFIIKVRILVLVRLVIYDPPPPIMLTR